MPEVIEAVRAAVSQDGPRRVIRLVRQPRTLSEQDLAGRPPAYPLLVATYLQVLTVAAERLPGLAPREVGHLSVERLQAVVRRVLDECVLDLHWAHRLVDQLVARREAGQRRTLIALLRDSHDPRDQLRSTATAEATDIRTALLDPRSLDTVLEALVADGFVARTPRGDGCCLPGAEDPPPAPFHAEALRETIQSHLAEVARWNLPAETYEQRLALARAHSQVLHAGSVAENSMLSTELRHRLQRSLELLLQPPDSRQEQVLARLLDGTDLPRGPQGAPDPYLLAVRLLPAVAEPVNVLAVLEQMAAANELLPRLDGQRREFADPTLDLKPPEAPPAAAGLAKTDFKQRLALLRELLHDGLITPDDYDRRKAAILDEL